MPLPASYPSMWAATLTLVPAAQYCAGRQCSELSENQCQAPATAGVVVTVSRLSKAACWAGGIGVLG